MKEHCPPSGSRAGDKGSEDSSTETGGDCSNSQDEQGTEDSQDERGTVNAAAVGVVTAGGKATQDEVVPATEVVKGAVADETTSDVKFIVGTGAGAAAIIEQATEAIIDEDEELRATAGKLLRAKELVEQLQLRLNVQAAEALAARARDSAAAAIWAAEQGADKGCDGWTTGIKDLAAG